MKSKYTTSFLFLKLADFPFNKIISDYGMISSRIKILGKKKSNISRNTQKEWLSLINEYCDNLYIMKDMIITVNDDFYYEPYALKSWAIEKYFKISELRKKYNV